MHSKRRTREQPQGVAGRLIFWREKEMNDRLHDAVQFYMFYKRSSRRCSKSSTSNQQSGC